MRTIHIKSIAVLGVIFLFVMSCAKESDLPKVATDKTLEPVLPSTPFDYNNNNGGWQFIDNKKAALGRVLFYDKILSINNTVACADCHKQNLGFADDKAFSTGFSNRLTLRNSMAIVNINDNSSLFWDLREDNIRSMVLKPIQNHIEMGFEEMEKVVEKIKATPYYANLFTKAYGSPANGNPVITAIRVSETLAEFVEALQSSNTRYDIYIETGATNHFTALELEGMKLFNEKLPCRDCHGGTDLGGWGDANIGLDMVYKDKGVKMIINRKFDDHGNVIFEETSSNAEGFFKIPSLRNIAYTAPYMHDGRFKTLEEVVEHYNGNVQNHKNLDWRLKVQVDPQTGQPTMSNEPVRWNLTAHQKTALVAFLKTLSDPVLLSNEKYANPFRLK